ncbi:hypothetical protein M426DRAFT_73311 [Hypoxylon sp. CI-4A]|nr:hypothetical protein M426DRAFT_73311 [Hypoxylon sp. CI-4A]
MYTPIGSLVSRSLPQLDAPDLTFSRQPHHVNDVSEKLGQMGLLKISLGFTDKNSQYLKQLLVSLHEYHGHELPISHSATRGWFWDVRPSNSDFQTENHQARSETMDQFPWHTDCSYEDPPPRFFALQVLQPDRCGGGTLSIMNVQRLSELLSSTSREALARPEYLISIPPEFIKDSAQRHIIGSLLFESKEARSSILRYREDILTPLNEEAARALRELNQVLHNASRYSDLIVRLTSDDLPEGSIVLVDNRRWLHARSSIKDPERHLRRE